MRPTAILGTLIPCFLLGSCGSLGQNAIKSREQPSQTLNPLDGAGNLASTAFRATALATVKQPVTSAKTGLALTWHRSREVVVGNVPISLEPASRPSEQPGTRAFDAMLDHEGLSPLQPGNVKCLVDGRRFFPELDRLLAEAKRSVDVQVYIFDSDDIACRYAERLRRLSSDLRVRVLFDDLGSTWAAITAPDTPAPAGFVPPADICRFLTKDSRVRVRRTLNPWLVSDHTKLMVFDDRTAVLGGMNIGREYFSEWHDLMVRVDGPVVKRLAREFDDAWGRAGPWGDLRALFPKRAIRVPDEMGITGRLRILRTDAARGRIDIIKAQIAAIRASRDRIWVETPYFASDEVAKALCAAAMRGVDVRVILPSRNDSTIMDAGNLETSRQLIRSGAAVFRYPGMTHMKVMICDTWATLGSANLDTLSMRINRELNIAFSDREPVSQLEREVFQEDFRKSRRLKIEETASPTGSIVESIADQL